MKIVKNVFLEFYQFCVREREREITSLSSPYSSRYQKEIRVLF